MKALIARFRGSFAIIVLIGAFLWSGFVIITTRAKEHPPGTTVIRIGHWQLEPGFRDGLKAVIAEYEKLHPNVSVVVDSIPESTYGQWVTTQLMGGTAPDIMEVGNSLPANVWVSYFIRYFTPLTSIAGKPNPYNEGTDLAGVPLRSTYKDGMIGGYVEEVQEIMRVPLSIHTQRIYYNKDLLKKLTGLDEAPTEYREFLKVCEQIVSQMDEQRGRNYVAIASSEYNSKHWEARLFDTLTYPAIAKGDLNRDGKIALDELYIAFENGIFDLDYEPFSKRMKMLWEISRYFPAGYIGLKRDEAVFRFIQQQAVFMPTGTWDAAGLRQQAAGEVENGKVIGRFELGVVNFPTPKIDDPEFGEYFSGPVFDSASTSCSFSVNRTSKHPDVAIDFLLFLTSRKINEQFNHRVSWIPAIVGANADPFMKPFEPQTEGIYPATGTFGYFGANSLIRWQQNYSQFQSPVRPNEGETVFEDRIKKLNTAQTEALADFGKKDFDEILRDYRRGAARNEQILAGYRGDALMGNEEAWIKYRSFLLARLIKSDLYNDFRTRLARKKMPFEAAYEYSSHALENIRKNALKSSPAEPSTNP